MKNLILIRHAKSSWEAPVHDKERLLATRGVQDAHLVSQKISEFLPKTNIIWSSTAKRAHDTALIFAQNILYPIENIEFKERGSHYEYLWLFFYEAFYITDSEGGIIRIREYFYKLFNFTYKKTRSELDMLTEIYKMLDQNLKK